MLFKENYKVVIIIGFLLHQSCYNYALLNTEQPVHIMFFSFMKGSNCSHKSRYNGY
jgi:hypothetical protein